MSVDDVAARAGFIDEAAKKNKQVVVTAIARELSAFLWAIAKQVQPVV